MFVAPLTPAVFGALSTPITDKLELLPILFLTPLFYFYTFLATIFLGVPAFLLGRRLRLIKWWSALVAGTVIGALVAVLIWLQSKIQVHDFIIFCPLGAASAFTFWLIWRCGHDFDDRDNKLVDDLNLRSD